MADAARAEKLQADIEALEAAEMSLITGAGVVRVNYDGHDVEFSRVKLAELQRVLTRKRAELRRAQGAGARSWRMIP